MLACKNARTPAQLLSYLLTLKFDPNAVDENGKTCLQIAEAACQSEEKMQILKAAINKN